MIKKLFFRWALLSILIISMISMKSCMHDEVYSSTETHTSKMYSSKSLWKEDEKYIKKIMRIYSKNEDEIRKQSGMPYWDYSLTTDSDESFLMVPVVDKGKVVSVLKVPRYKNKVYFIYTNNRNEIIFFQKMIYSVFKKILNPETDNTVEKVTCTTKKYSVWLPDSESSPEPSSGSGHWQQYQVTTCKQDYNLCSGYLDENGICVPIGGGFGYDGGDGSGTDNPQNPEEKTPCEKAKEVFNNLAVKSRYNVLKTKVSASAETGYGFKTVPGPNGTTGIQTHSLNPDAGSADKMNVTIYPTTFGYSHTHLNKPNYEVTVKIFSPRDIDTFIAILRNARNNGIPLETVFGGMVASDPDTIYNTYQIQYTGDGSDLPGAFTDKQLETLKVWYTKEAQDIQTEQGELTHYDLQKLLNETLKKMNLKDTVLFKIEGNSNTIEKVNYNEAGSPSEASC